jgi:hypothetical protein
MTAFARFAEGMTPVGGYAQSSEPRRRQSMSNPSPNPPTGPEPADQTPGWYPPESGAAGTVQYWDGARWSGLPVRANRWGTAPRDILGWIGVWLVVLGSAATAILTVISVSEITSTQDGGPGLADNGATFPLAWFVGSGAVIAAGTLCGLAASIRAESRNYTSAQARIALKAGGGLLLATVTFALTGLAVLALGIVVAVIVFVLGLIVLGAMFALS